MSRNETCRKLDALQSRAQSHVLTRFLTSGVALAFFYGMFLLSYEVQFFRQIVPVLHPLLILWAVFVAGWQIVVRRSWRQVFGWKLLALFALSAAVSVVLNWKLGPVSNLKAWVMTVLPLAAFLPVCQLERGENRMKALLLSMLGGALVLLPAVLLSLLLYLLHFGGTVELFGIRDFVGLALYDPRYEDSGLLLYGMFVDPNHASMYALGYTLYHVLLLHGCLQGIFHRRWQNLLGAGFAGVSIAALLFYFPLANSRGGWVCLWAGGLIVLALYFACGKRLAPGCGRNAWRSVLLALTLTAVGSMTLLGSRSVMTSSAASVAAYRAEQAAKEEAQLQENPVEPTKPRPPYFPYPGVHNIKPVEPPCRPHVEIENELSGDSGWGSFDKQSGSFGAGRLGLWAEALKLYPHRPVFGEVPGNNQAYAQQYGVSGFLSEGKAVHNSYLDLLLDYGLAGTALLLGFLLVCLLRVLRRITGEKERLSWTYYAAATGVLLTAGAAVLLSCMFTTTSAMYFLFLIPLGYVVAPEA